nr:MAG TPA: hypothetical protein [Caudoviricetes sp.]DAM78334.1 MAG TPA: hypothetical protein [Caudoviricetes sp.]
MKNCLLFATGSFFKFSLNFLFGKIFNPPSL